MAKSLGGLYAGDIRPILGAIRTVPIPVKTVHAEVSAPPAAPFITISREAGAGGRSLAERLVARLNQVDPADQPWTAWDRELVEKVSADFAISRRLIESIEESSRSWLQDMLSGMCISDQDNVDEVKVYHKVATTIRALAQVGRVIFVGRGAVYVTANMPGGIHVRLVAPLAWRIGYMSRLLNISESAAAAEVARLERNRTAFLKRYWPSQYQRTDLYHLTLNMAAIPEDKAVEAILQLVPRHMRGPA